MSNQGKAIFNGNQVTIINSLVFNQKMEVLITLGSPEELQWVKFAELNDVVWFIAA